MAEEPVVFGAWRVERIEIAPWSDDASAGKVASPLGAAVRLGKDSVAGPHPLACANAHWETTSTPADGLFQGNLPAPAETAARNLGIGAFPVAGAALDCDSGAFEFHFADASTLLLALDNRIWTLSRAPGALAPAGDPEALVQRFLEMHFSGDMAFDAKSARLKQAFLSRSLAALVAGYMKKPQSPDEVPTIDGDPYTDSQDTPTRFAVGRATPAGVPVAFNDCCSKKEIVYRLVKQGGKWRVDDLVYADGSTFRALLTAD